MLQGFSTENGTPTDERNAHEFTLKVWRQKAPTAEASFHEYTTKVLADTSFLEMLDCVNDDLDRRRARSRSAFDHDCREGICGTCGW
jgi:succinate dehydrogenase / fumarate reductase iron-sulfur subunit